MAISLTKHALDVGIVTADAERLVRFYRDAFGLESLGDLVLPGVGTIHRLLLGPSLLRIFVPETAPTGEPGEGGLTGRPGYRYLSFEVENLTAALDEVETHGGRVVFGPVEPRPGRRIAQIVDPDGNLSELAQNG